DQLDLALEQQVTRQLRQLGIGLVIVSHRPETVRQVDRLVRLGEPAAPQAAAPAAPSAPADPDPA
ncbi:MAG: hypothetical protein ACK515_11540, partial [bacterium]